MSRVGAELPKGWVRVRLGEILDRIEAGKSYKCEPRPAGPDEWGVIKVSAMTWGDFDESENKTVPAGFEHNPDYEIKPGDILLSRANTAAYVGASVLVKQCRPRLLLSDKSLRLLPANGIDREWLAYLLSSPSVRSQISERATGTKDSMRNISQGALAEIECLLPPLGEQRRIVAALEEGLSRLDAAQQAFTSTGRRIELLHRSVLKTYFSPHSCSAQHRHRLEPLEKVARIQGGSTPRKGEIDFESIPSEANVPFWKVGDMNDSNGRYLTQSRTYVHSKDIQHAGLKVHPEGTIIIPKRGGAIATNKKRITGTLGTFDLNVMGITPGNTVRPDYLWYWFQSIDLQELADGSNVPQINKPDLQHLLVPIPEISVQQRIAERLDKLFAHLSVAQGLATSNKPNLLRAAFLRDAFAGRLVPQDPNDEPAEELLARIRAEREAAAPKKRRTRRAPAQRKATHDEPPPAPAATATTPLTGEQPTLDLEFPS
ncbi:restriction endonuclease subunit S [Streptomyces botrytidirepellens]|uniref:Type I restriction modification DNA specificity domain-containing protein n=1 Tax=Streptomyces botrytidirepellens TaxID=2486417 RepID=A0A3M8VX44_9ACTN|nr:restriction endonuclease subunit S [Streptomyces botrytidirepellens]RNG22296.1 hypothetical protein EEJ42_21055 [Streptomyces botrytidirepellens]